MYETGGGIEKEGKDGRVTATGGKVGEIKRERGGGRRGRGEGSAERRVGVKSQRKKRRRERKVGEARNIINGKGKT